MAAKVIGWLFAMAMVGRSPPVPLSFSVLSAFSSSIRSLAVAVLPCASRKHQGSRPAARSCALASAPFSC